MRQRWAFVVAVVCGCSGASTGGTGGGGGGGATPGVGGTTGVAGAMATAGQGGGSGLAGAPGVAGASGAGGGTGGATSASCTGDLATRVRVTETDLGVAYAYNEVDNNGRQPGPDAARDLAAIPGGGSRVAFLGKTDGMVHVATLDAADQVVPGSVFALSGYDVQDIHADAAGGVLLVSRPAMGATANHNCGDINNLCGLVANYPTAASCYDMYMVRFDGSTETWATKLTETSRHAARLRHQRHRRWQRDLHLVAVRAQRADRVRRHELRRLLRRRDHGARTGLRRREHARERREHPPGRSHEGRQRQRRPADERVRLGLQPQRLRARRVGRRRAEVRRRVQERRADGRQVRAPRVRARRDDHLPGRPHLFERWGA